MADPNTSKTDSPLQSHLHRLLNSRAPEKTICPSEAARALSASELNSEGVREWRELMPRARELLFDLRASGRVEILQKGVVLDEDTSIEDVRGPIRARWAAQNSEK